MLRYAAAGDMAGADALLTECLSEAMPRMRYAVCYGEFPIQITDRGVLTDAFVLPGKDAAKHLAGCHKIVLFAATVGMGIDRLIAKYGVLAPSKALFMQGLGAERIESLCDVFCKELEAEKEKTGEYVRPRFSPGYGDLPLSVQRDIFRVLEPSRKIGLTLNESLLMSPAKSVTAIVGISKAPCGETHHTCGICDKKDCAYRSI